MFSELDYISIINFDELLFNQDSYINTHLLYIDYRVLNLFTSSEFSLKIFLYLYKIFIFYCYMFFYKK